MAYMANYQEEPELVAEQLREVSFLNLYFDWTSIQNTYPAFQVWAVNCFLPIPTLLLDRIFTRLYTCKFKFNFFFQMLRISYLSNNFSLTYVDM